MKKFLYDWGVLLLIVIGITTFLTWMFVSIIRERRMGNEVKDYCGYVIDKGYDPPSSGYKSHTDAQYWIVFQDEDCHKAIRVHVTPGAYYEDKLDNRVCFSLSASELKWYGNTNEIKHLK